MPQRSPVPVARLVAVACVFVLLACGSGETDRGAAESDSSPPASVLEVTAKDFEFEAPGEVPSGWTTIRFTNEGEQDHFVYLYRLPDSVSFARYRQEVPKVFSDIYNQYASGELTGEEMMETLGEELPPYFFGGVVPSGGVALTDPGETATATVDLPPGTYVMECYVKTPKGTWHTDRGMLKELTVTEEAGGAEPPEADVTLTLSNYRIGVEGTFSTGEQTVAVRVAESPDGLMAHDVNLLRLDGETSLDSVVAWMNWMDPGEFRSPSPGTNLGGLDHLAAGRTGYIKADLEPGRYALVSEAYGGRGMAHEFTVR